MKRLFIEFFEEVREWKQGWYYSLEKKLHVAGVQFESLKDIIVDVLMARRGTYQRPFLHISLIVLVIAGATSAPILASTYPGVLPQNIADFTAPSAVAVSLDATEGVETQVSEKPRDQIISYTVQEGDTLKKVAEQFGVSIDSIKWANDTKRDTLSINQVLKIPPVTGVVHKVKEGETIYSIAKKYKTEPQQIVNFPFNDFTDPETFALAIGQTLVVPGGVVQEVIPVAAPAVFIPTIAAGGTGQLSWPTSGVVTQYPSWYHMALDIASPAAPGIAAADSGIITVVEYMKWGYGNYATIEHGNGVSTLYGHMQAIYVKPGDKVTKGQIIGKMGSTGRSTGTHLHFEVRKNGATVNPSSFLK